MMAVSWLGQRPSPAQHSSFMTMAEPLRSLRTRASTHCQWPGHPGPGGPDWLGDAAGRRSLRVTYDAGPTSVTVTRKHQQSGQCLYITNMQNLNPALFCILILGFAYYYAYWCIYMQNNMQNMLHNMQINSAGFRFCIFCILQYAKYAEYVK